MNSPDPVRIQLRDYAPSPWCIEHIALDFDIRADSTRVTSVMHCIRNARADRVLPLVLQGEGLETRSISVDGRTLSPGEYALNDDTLTIPWSSDALTLRTEVLIHPETNTQLSGLYKSRNGYFTQCEPEGFRRITWFIDRPDVMARYTVTLHADKDEFPVLLANGNPLASGDEDDGRHFAVWEDPFRKPSYLFAKVAARLDGLHDSFRTKSGREVQLAIYVEPGKLDQCPHAMAALKKSMRWDEERFGLECDLDHYMIVAVGDFNMGAMENKGLNIFNTKYVLARQDVATDADFENIDRVVAHEYFHNWTGNRVTCRDWFQLSLKEGLTVFRDQEFGADTHGRETARIREVRGLRALQFPEDAGPMAHPVRPSSYIEINNFYTSTVYEKGAEVVRMIQTLIGEKTFRAGMDLYFSRHDGQAVTCDEFIAAMADSSGMDFTQFMNWYCQAGTPRVRASGTYDAAGQRYSLHLSQSCASPPGLPDKDPYLIPVSVGLVDPAGKDCDLGGTGTCLLQLAQSEETFTFENIPTRPVPSLLRNFSAPVHLEYVYSDEELAHLLAHDSDPFNCWEAGQRLFSRLILSSAERSAQGASQDWPEQVAEAADRVLLSGRNPAFIAEVLTLPGETTLAEQFEVVDPEALYAARTGLAGFLSARLEAGFRRLHDDLAASGPYRTDPAEVARRRLRNLCLAYLNECESADGLQRALRQFDLADNMTDNYAALSVLVNTGGAAAGKVAIAALETFYARWRYEDLVVDKWLAVQAGCRLPGTLARVEALTRHPAFDLHNPNKVYALLRTFGANHRNFHAGDGSGYRFLAGQIARLDRDNPQIAARLARCFDRWRRFDAVRQGHAREALEGLRCTKGLSRDVFEVVDKGLA